MIVQAGLLAPSDSSEEDRVTATAVTCRDRRLAQLPIQVTRTLVLIDLPEYDGPVSATNRSTSRFE